MGSTRSQGLSYLLFEFPGGQHRERKWASITKKEIEPLSLSGRTGSQSPLSFIHARTPAVGTPTEETNPKPREIKHISEVY